MATTKNYFFVPFGIYPPVQDQVTKIFLEVLILSFEVIVSI